MQLKIWCVYFLCLFDFFTEMLLYVLMWISLLFWFFVYFLPSHYFSELAVSFLPYGVIFLFFMIIFSFLWMRNVLRKKRKSVRWNKKVFSRTLLLIGSFILFVSFLIPFCKFYTGSLFKWFWYQWVEISENKESSLQILYGNLLKNNVEYEKIEALIENEDPDMIMFVEFADHHYDELWSFLESKYPYVNRTTWSKNLMVGSMVFSKYPLDSLVWNFDQWAWRYWYFSLYLNDEAYYFYLLHTSSPVSFDFYEMRNSQLKRFVEDFNKHAEYRDNQNVVLIWDLNLSPWSAFYNKFVQSLPSNMFNYTRKFPILFSWHDALFWINWSVFWSHIDHIFVNESLEVYDINSFQMPWSDHNWFVIEMSF